MNELIRLDAFVSMRDMNVRARSPPHGHHPVWRKMHFGPLFSENTSKHIAIFFKCQLLSDVTTQSTITSSDVL